MFSLAASERGRRWQGSTIHSAYGMRYEPIFDVEIYQAVHELVGEAILQDDRERRQLPRYEYRSWQRIIPADEMGCELSVERSLHVEFSNLSDTGAAFWLPHPPAQKFYILELGTAPQFVHLLAEVMQVSVVCQGIVVRYLVNCRLIKKLTLRGPHETDSD